ncbi:TerB family tellurite resistance protein [Oculatella sp. LEGE 06141]|uniref:tellurite resistance TerB family protein n=1 Tax=Oculatella sp. LEGE 06141 TaxID=1828648 RepID=UPI0018826DD1|nr:TerB family tellurite resistance protein [Oculatella sp. LEGE 06141]MBE9180116.1 TerB family tellurite resistance protein [Oculatella sp. LEGE 06141]
MALQTPPPPSITPRQMNLLRIVSSMAWSDGNLAEEEVEIMLDRFSSIFSEDSAQKNHLSRELQDYLMQNIPLEELTPKLQTKEEKELVLRLGYEVIQSSARAPGEEIINEEEAVAYNKLAQLLGFSPEDVSRIESEVTAGEHSEENIIDSLTRQLEEFMQG